MGIKIVQRKKIYEEVAEQLMALIKSGELLPGDRLDSVEELSRQFDVGRSTIREALTALRAMGLIEMKQGEGTFVKNFDGRTLGIPLASALLMTKKDIAELLEVRRVLEVGMVKSAAENRTMEDLAALKGHLQEMYDHTDQPKIAEQADLAFHYAIAKATHNEMLQSLFKTVNDVMSEVIHDTRLICLYDEQATFETLNAQHLHIFNAIASQNIDQANEAMTTHLQFVEDVLNSYVAEQKEG